MLRLAGGRQEFSGHSSRIPARGISIEAGFNRTHVKKTHIAVYLEFKNPFSWPPRVKRIRGVSAKVLKHLRIRRWDFGSLQFNAYILIAGLGTLTTNRSKSMVETRDLACFCAILSLFRRRFCL